MPPNWRGFAVRPLVTRCAGSKRNAQLHTAPTPAHDLRWIGGEPPAYGGWMDTTPLYASNSYASENFGPDTQPISRGWYEPPRSSARPVALAVVIGLGAVAAGVGGYLWWQQQQAAPPVAEAASAVAASASAPAEAASAVAEPAIQYPIENVAAAAPLPDKAAARAPAGGVPAITGSPADAPVVRGLADLLGTRTMVSMLQLDGFVRRVVATVDNLDRTHAAQRLWPVVPPGGRFTVQAADGAQAIAPANSARYAAFVRFVESVDSARAVALYVKLYPQFQQAYQDLGYPRGYFNDRLVAVIDKLLATPQPAAPVAVRLTEVKGPIALQYPWLHYEFADPALQSLPSGQKLLLRMGPDNARRLKAKLSEFRAAIAQQRTSAS
jgi:hypothetical protein